MVHVNKKKIFFISDNPFGTSGVACQSRWLIEGLKNTGKYSFRTLGAAIRHEYYDPIVVDEDLITIPVDGFGTKEQIRNVLALEKPDAMVIFSDPRFYTHVIEMHNEIQNTCPLMYWTIWDQCEFAPSFNKLIYDSFDTLNAINYPVYDFLSGQYPDQIGKKINFIPHSLPDHIFKPLSNEKKAENRRKLLQGKRSDFIALWVNRNASRKKPGDLLWSWKMFVDKVKITHPTCNPQLVLHTDPKEPEGMNILYVIDHFGLRGNVILSTEKIGFEDMRQLYSAVDVVVNRSNAEGFGLSTLEAMYCGLPIIALKTGGLERQVVDYRDNSENGIALPVELKSLVGSQMVPGIIEDYVSNETVANAFYKMFEMGPGKRAELGQKAAEYAKYEFSYSKMINSWDRSIEETIERHSKMKRWEAFVL